MPEIDITNVIQIDVSTPPAGLTNYNINNLAYFTKKTPEKAYADGYAVYRTPSGVAADWGVYSEIYQAAVTIFSQSPNILTGGGALIVIPMTETESLLDAINRAKELVYFGGVLVGFDPWDGEAEDDPDDDDKVLDACKAIQSMDKMLFLASPKLNSVVGDGFDSNSGLFARIKKASLTHTRMLLYTPHNYRLMAAAYAGRAMSTNFSGASTTSTMHLKELATITPDPLVNETVLDDCRRIGPDVYVDIAGLPKIFTSGANDFFDNIYNMLWFKGALEVAGFNALATTSTKLPQTEPGMSVLKGAYRLICEQALANGFISPGAWNSPELFGDPESLRRNVLERGYYIYSQPVNEQPQADREARKAPLVQIAIKFAGAIHSTNLIIYINR